MQNRFLFYRIRGYRSAKTMHHSLRRFKKSEVAQEKAKIILFYEHYGEQATKEAFGVDRKVISRWRQRLKSEGVEGLVPHSTRPFNVRKQKVSKEIIIY